VPSKLAPIDGFLISGRRIGGPRRHIERQRILVVPSSGRACSSWHSDGRSRTGNSRCRRDWTVAAEELVASLDNDGLVVLNQAARHAELGAEYRAGRYEAALLGLVDYLSAGWDVGGDGAMSLSIVLLGRREWSMHTR
jgi:hypothetical protein